MLISADPSPEGTVIPWPALTMNDVAQARIITVPIAGEPAWAMHPCPVN
jgi:hypothetical protein